jgi:A/G-specific adenine glycosylase
MNEEQISLSILKWWEKNKRKYPWRETKDPYEILIAEFMLQRTKANQVFSIYNEFLQMFPTIQSLSEGSEDQIALLIKRLGLQRKIKKIKEMATYIQTQYPGKIPEDRKTLTSIPGIGDYTADAILSFAFNQQVVVIDSNVCRILCRVFGLRVKGESRRNPIVRSLATSLLYSNIISKDLNLALIDFGALICKSRKPLCHQCPLNDVCSNHVN